MINVTRISVTTTKPKRLIQPNSIGSTCGNEGTFEFKSGKVWGLRTFATPATRWLHSTARWNVSSQDPRWNVCRICCYTLRAASNALTNYMYRAAACADRLFLPRSTYLRRVWLTRATQPLTRSCYPWNRPLLARWNFRYVFLQHTVSSSPLLSFDLSWLLLLVQK